MRSRRHYRHSALLITCGVSRIMVDCGADWLKAIRQLAPTAIVLTHGHGDHAFGLAGGVPCPVYATKETWALIERFPLPDRKLVTPRSSLRIGSVRYEAFPVDHSLRAPAVGYRVTAEVRLLGSRWAQLDSKILSN